MPRTRCVPVREGTKKDSQGAVATHPAPLQAMVLPRQQPRGVATSQAAKGFERLSQPSRRESDTRLISVALHHQIGLRTPAR